MNQHSNTPEGRVPWKVFTAYSIGGMAYSFLGNGIALFALYVLNIQLGISPTAVGILMAAPRLLDAVLDPFMGHISDSFQSRWGRRRPFVLWGGVASGLLYFLLWQIPASWAPYGYFWAFLILSVLFYIGTTVFSVPWLALGYDLTEDVKERTRVMAGVQITSSIAGIAMVWLFPITQLKVFSSTLDGVHWISTVLALFTTIVGVIVFFYCHERHAQQSPIETKSIQESYSLKSSMRDVFRNRPFLILCGVVVAMLLGIMSVNSLTPYIIIYYLHAGDMPSASTLIATNGMVWTLTGLMMVPLVTWASNRFGKKLTLGTCLALALAGNLLKWNLYSPAHPWTVTIPQFFVSLAFASLWTLLNAMIADACDYSELQTGKRIEGIMAGIYGWLMKVGVALAFFASGLLIDITGFDKAAGATQPDGVITAMRLTEMGLPAIAYTVAILLLMCYPLHESRMKSVQAELRIKRSEKNPSLNPTF